MMWRNVATRLVMIAAVLVSAACAPARPPVQVAGGDISRQAASEIFSAGYRNITERYIDKVAVETLALEGMRGLGAIDPALTVNRFADKMVLAADGETVATFPVPSDGSLDRWAGLTVDAFLAGRAYSPELHAASVEKVYEAVFDGALSNLDIFSRYAGSDEAARNRAKRDGFDGIGIRFRIVGGKVRVTSVIPASPAERAGLKKNDHITHINRISVDGMKTSVVVDRLRGPVRTRVGITALRENHVEPLTFNIERSHIVPATVAERTENRILFLSVDSFNQDTAHSVADKIKAALGKDGKGLIGIVLDLRGNPGGLLKQSIKVADLFLTQGRIISTRGRHPDSLQHYEADGADHARGLPLVVLVDGKSASASEIVAAALQDRARAVIVGTTSFGKGTVQTVIRLPNDGEITLTWSRLIAPSGYALHGLGIRPAICTSGEIGDGGRLITRTLSDVRKAATTLADWRKTTLKNEKRRLALRSSCPPRRQRQGLEIAIAKRLIHDRALYSGALGLSLTSTAARF